MFPMNPRYAFVAGPPALMYRRSAESHCAEVLAINPYHRLRRHWRPTLAQQRRGEFRSLSAEPHAGNATPRTESHQESTQELPQGGKLPLAC